MHTDAQWLFLCDIDGTLVRRDVPVHADVIRAARTYTGAGGLLALCSGRAPVSCAELAGQLGVNCPCILHGGGMLYDFSQAKALDTHAFQISLDPVFHTILRDYPDVSLQVYTEQEVYTLQRNDRLNRRGVAEENYGPIRSPQEIKGAVLKVVMCCDSIEHLEACRTLFPEDTCFAAFASRNFVDVVPNGFGKLDAMQRLTELLGIAPARVFYAGDGMTDVPLLLEAGHSFAPENAQEQVRRLVNTVVPSVEEGGIAAAFELALSMMQETELL